MYSGSTLTNASGNILGTHQKIDKSSRFVLKSMLANNDKFPSKKLILHFEGKNGPDSAKSKLDGVHAPWHFYDPFDPSDGQLIRQMKAHYKQLVKSLKDSQMERSAFEASWLAHAIVDGLTPAHHYPFEEELEKLRGEGKETRDTVFKKVFISGNTKLDILRKNWEMWGSKGLFTTHALFELGAAMIIAPMTRKELSEPNRYDTKTYLHLGFEEYFKRTAREIAVLYMYEDFYKRGWTRKLAHTVKHELAPRMGKTVTLTWYLAAKDAGIASGEV